MVRGMGNTDLSDVLTKNSLKFSHSNGSNDQSGLQLVKQWDPLEGVLQRVTN